MKKLLQLPSRWITVSTFLTLILIIPIALIVFNAFGAQSDTLIHLKKTVLSDYIINTLILLGGVCSLSLIFGVGSAYFVTFYDFKFSKFFSVVLVLPFIIPSYILGFIYSDILGFFGPFHLFLKDLGITNYFDVLNMKSVIIILALALYPYIYLIVKASFSKHSSYLLNPALSLGISRFKIFYKIILPLSRPAIIGALSLVMMETISEYGLVKYFGVDTLSTAVFTAWFGLNDPNSAAYISTIAMAMVFTILIIEKFNRGGARYKVESVSTPVKKIQTNFLAQSVILLFLAIPFILGFLIPIIWIVKYSLVHYIYILDEEYIQTIFNSFFAAFISASLIVMIAILLAYSARIFDNRYMKYLLKIATLGYSIPGAVIAVGIIIVSTSIDKYLIETFNFDHLVLGGSIVILCFGYTVRFLAVALNSAESSFEKVGINVNKASRSLNKSFFTTLIKVDLPLIKSGVIAAFILVFIDILKELPATLILRPFNYETLATKTYELASIDMVQESSIYALTIVLISIIPIIYILKDTDEKHTNPQ
jgi:iron(III) transport system permease protein